MVGGIVAAVVLGSFFFVWPRSSYMTRQREARAQPVPFYHLHHVGGMGIDCRYCHTSVETSAFAGIPPTETCMNCHAELWKDSPMLAPVRESYRTGKPLVWRRVHDVPDFAYFDHSIHIHKGVACVACHGRVDQMPLMWREATLHMEWCLDCHRGPQKFIVERDKVFDMTCLLEDVSAPERSRLMEDYRINPKTDCSTCHR